MRPTVLLTIPSLALVALAGCGGGGGGGSSSSSTPSNPTRGLVQFDDLPSGHAVDWTAGRHVHFKPEIQFGSSRHGDVAIPWQIRSGSATGTVVVSGTSTATDFGDATHSFFVAPETDVDLSAQADGADLWIVLDPDKTLVDPSYSGAVYDFYREEEVMVPASG